jgi:hypothetical protein
VGDDRGAGGGDESVRRGLVWVDSLMDARLRLLWMHFLWSFTLSDHLGDAAEAIRGFAKKANLPIPSDHAELDSESEDPADSWLAWIKSQGVEAGIHSPELHRQLEGL